MPIVRSDSQGGGDVCEHYLPDGNCDECTAISMESMVRLIKAICDATPQTQIWALTSHYSLGLMNVPKYGQGKTLVVIHLSLDNFFRIEYRPRDGLLPAPNPMLHCNVRGIESAVQRVLVYLKASGGWPMSADLG